MRLLTVLAVVSCCAVLASGLAAWWSVRHTRKQPHSLEAVSERQAKRAPHPRIDLAAGVVPGTQFIRPGLRNRGLRPDSPEDEKDPAGPAPPPDRPDWAYYNEDFGDLADPDPGRPPAGGVRRPTGTLSVPESW